MGNIVGGVFFPAPGETKAGQTWTRVCTTSRSCRTIRFDYISPFLYRKCMNTYFCILKAKLMDILGRLEKDLRDLKEGRREEGNQPPSLPMLTRGRAVD